ncbi:2656_t:CDS:2, partial [Paraglomus occultum]
SKDAWRIPNYCNGIHHGYPTTQFFKHDLAITTSISIYEDLEKAITQVLHPQELVFADLQPPNILIVHPGWQNMDQITWPERVIPGTVLKKEDDKFMLDIDRLKYALNL